MPPRARSRSQRLVTRVAALHRMWPLLSGGRWYSRHARSALHPPASAGLICFVLLTTRPEISLLVHKAMRSQGVEDFHFRTRFPRTDEWRGIAWLVLLVSSPERIQCPIHPAGDFSIKKTEQHCSPACPPWLSEKLGRSQRVLPLRVHINKEKWFTSATDSMHERGSLHFLIHSWKWLLSQSFLGTGQGQFA